MSKWIFSKPDEKTEPGEHVFALVVYTGEGREVGVRCMERAEVAKKWNQHAFAWQPIVYPHYSFDDMAKLVEVIRATPVEVTQ